MGNKSKKKVLLLCNYYPGAAGAITDHIFAFQKYSKNDYFILSMQGHLPGWLDLSRFDAIIFHYSLIASYDSYISPAGRQRIREFDGFKAAFVQDDYRWINDTVNAFAYMGIHALFPLTGPEIMDLVYSYEKLPGARKTTVLAGYVPQDLVNIAVMPYEERTLDVGYRARKLPPWMGAHTLQKWQIADNFLLDVRRYGLKVDISWREDDRIYGDDWIKFLTNCRATLGTESGASICDFTGDIQRNVEDHLQQYPDADFETLRDLYFKDEDGKIMMNVISPRCFEAAALRTLMILYEGHYSGILVPWRHYVPLKPDHSNMDEVVRILNSPVEANKIIHQAYEEVAKNEKYSYKAMVQLVDKVMAEEWRSSLVPAKNAYKNREFEWYKTNSPVAEAKKNLPLDDQFLFFQPRKIECLTENSGPHGVAEVSLGTLLKPQQIAIRWDTELRPPPMNYEIVELRNGNVVERLTQINPDQDVFQLLQFPSTAKSIDMLQVWVSKYAQHGPVLEIIVQGRDPIILCQRFKQLIARLILLPRHVWSMVPENLRRKLRPIVHLIPQTLRRSN